jgi:hypothetical protein
VAKSSENPIGLGNLSYSGAFALNAWSDIFHIPNNVKLQGMFEKNQGAVADFKVASALGV